jgi:lipopolysaccharide/colanic/teichoic acid biosynthesis glycosyltransferase
MARRTFYAALGKRLLDLAVAVPGTLLAVPPLIAVAALVRLRLGGPVLFRQERPGRGGRLFTLYKFRTMLNSSGKDGKPLADGERPTELGRWLRKWSLDELPELYNVLKGDMSLVGPRPLLPRYLERYTAEQRRRHEVKPGLTGWAQVNGRNAILWEKKFELDVWYVDHLSFSLDLEILLRTVAAVIRREGISAEGEETMPEFMGTEKPGRK